MIQLKAGDLDMFYADNIAGPFMAHGGIQELMKTAYPVLTSSGTGFFNSLYGAKAWCNLNMESNVFGLIPKTDWSRSGIRMVTDTGTTYTEFGISESESLQDSDIETIATYKLTPKVQCRTFEVSDVMEGLIQMGADDIYGSVDQLRQIRSMDFARGINKMLLKDVEAEAAAAIGTYAEGKLIQTLDRAISSDAEEDAYGGTYSGYYDWYTLDRDTLTTYDSTVSMDSTSDQELDDTLLRTYINTACKNGGNLSVLVTGWDTYTQLQGIYQSYMRYDQWGETQVKVGVNGIEGAKGTDVGIKVAAVLGIPLIKSQDVTVDGTSRIYGLDISDPEGNGEPRMGLNLIRPTEYFESRDFMALGKFVTKGAYRLVGELGVRHFKGQMKIRDLSA